MIKFVIMTLLNNVIRRDGLVGYDAAFTQLRSWVQFPLFVEDSGFESRAGLHGPVGPTARRLTTDMDVLSFFAAHNPYITEPIKIVYITNYATPTTILQLY